MSTTSTRSLPGVSSRISAILLLLVAGTVLHRSAFAADATPNSQPAKQVDVTQKLEVVLGEKLIAEGKNRYSLELKIRNPHPEPIPGRLLFVVESLKPKSLTCKNEDGFFPETDEDFFELVGDRKLAAAEKSLPPQKLLFESDQPLTDEERLAFQLTYRVVRLKAMAVAEKKDFRPWPAKSEVQRVIAVQNQWSERLFAIPGVHGNSTAITDNGQVIIQVFLDKPNIDVPKVLDGVPVEAIYQPPLRIRWHEPANRHGLTPVSNVKPLGTTVPSPTQHFTRPVPIGVSVGPLKNVDPTFCIAGTLGCRVLGSDGTKYFLSNNHVVAQINQGKIGDQIVQPATAENGCREKSQDVVGTLANFKSIDISQSANNRMDAGIVKLSGDTVSAASPTEVYGAPLAKPVDANLNMNVMKYGRTTSFTHGRVRAINASQYVDYGDTTPRLAKFTGQIVFVGTSGNLGSAGDSGALIVTESTKAPVALLFAGGGGITVGNPIQEVLDNFQVTIDDGASTGRTTTGGSGGTTTGGSGGTTSGGGGGTTSGGSGGTTSGGSGGSPTGGSGGGSGSGTGCHGGNNSSSNTPVTTGSRRGGHHRSSNSTSSSTR